MTQLASRYKARVIERRKNGSVLVQVPVTVETKELDLERTSGGRGGVVSITRAELEEMVRNFDSYPDPGVGFDGLDGHQDDRRGPQSAFLNRVWVEGAALMGEVELNAEVAGMVDRYRGFSMEAEQNLERPTGRLDGWTLTGGIFTNRPAVDATFRIAASEKTGRWATNIPLSWGEESKMAEDKTLLALREENHAAKLELDETKSKLATAKTQLAEAVEAREASEAKLDDLKAELAGASSRTAGAERQLKSATKALAELQEKHSTLEASVTGDAVVKLVEGAIDAGVPPAMFEGYEDNPQEWVSRFGGLDGFRAWVEPLRKVAASTAGTALKSGHDPAKADADAKKNKALKVLDQPLGPVGHEGITRFHMTEEQARASFGPDKQEK